MEIKTVEEQGPSVDFNDGAVFSLFSEGRGGAKIYFLSTLEPKNHYLINTAARFFPFLVLGGKWKRSRGGSISQKKKKSRF